MPVRNNVNTVEVLDAGRLRDFLVHARKAWTAAHPEAVGRRGRPSSEGDVFDACKTICQQQRARGQLTQGQLIRKVKELLGVQCPSSDTVERHVKGWVACHWTLDDLSPAYLRTKEGKEICGFLTAIAKLGPSVLEALQKQAGSLGAILEDLQVQISKTKTTARR